MRAARERWRRRASLRAAVFAAALVSLGIVLLPQASARGGRDEPPVTFGRPNIVVIMTDDQTLESVRVMKNVRNLLAAEGTTFTNSFVSFSLCCPSRATFLTGQYSHNNGVVGNVPQNGLDRLDDTRTLPVWLKRRSYKTVFVGKYLNGYGKLTPRRIPPGWDEWYAGTSLGYYRHSMNRNGKLVKYGDKPSDYQTSVYARTGVSAIRRLAAGKKPLFLWLGFFAPHHGGPKEDDDPTILNTPVAAPRHRGAFANEPLPESAAFNEADVSDKPDVIRRRARLNPDVVAAIESSYRQRLESLLAVDDAVGQIVAELRRSGQLERTLIVFTSDNGFFQGEHRLSAGKEHLYEPSIRVPLILRGPDVPRGRRLAEMVANIDLAPTLVDAANARADRVMDGRSLFPILRDDGIQWGRDLLIERGPGGAGLVGHLFTAIRTPRYIYAEHHTGQRELYDLLRDPEELTSLHGDAALAGLQAELARRLAVLRTCRGDVCRRGPDLRLALSEQDGCVRAARVTGDDVRLVRLVEFALPGRATAEDAAAPFERVFVESGPASAAPSLRMRVRMVLEDGRRKTIDRDVRACVPPAAGSRP